jgi:hypothetical protein
MEDFEKQEKHPVFQYSKDRTGQLKRVPLETGKNNFEKYGKEFMSLPKEDKKKFI